MELGSDPAAFIAEYSSNPKKGSSAENSQASNKKSKKNKDEKFIQPKVTNSIEVVLEEGKTEAAMEKVGKLIECWEAQLGEEGDGKMRLILDFKATNVRSIVLGNYVKHSMAM
jgi:hypothetical protein